mgnify:CR=1 FL=1
MKKRGKKLAVFVLSVILALGSFSVLAACNSNDDPNLPPEKTVSSIEVTTPPSKTKYVAGESFDSTGMVITANYSDKTSAPVTGYTVDKTTLSVSDTTVTITYEGKTCTQAITVSAATEERVVKITFTEPSSGATLKLYDNGKLYMMEGTESETPFDWALGDDGLIVVDTGSMSAYVSFKSYKANGFVYLDVDQSMGGGLVTYSVSVTEYYEIFDLTAQEVGRVESGDDLFILYDTGDFSMTVGGATTKGSTIYNAAETDADKAQFILVPEGAENEEDYITAAVGAYDNIFTIENVFVIPNARLESWLGYTMSIVSGTDKGADMEYYFYADGTVAFVIEKEGIITEIERKYMTFEYDNSDLAALSLTINTMAPTAGFKVAYNGDDDEFTLTYTEKEMSFGEGGMSFVDKESYSFTVDGITIDDALKNAVKEVQTLYTLQADHGNKADGSEVSGEYFNLIIKEDGKCELSFYNIYTEGTMTLGNGGWTYSQEEGFGFVLTSSYISGGFFTGGLNGADKTSITVSLTISSAATVTFTVEAEQWAEMAAALSK